MGKVRGLRARVHQAAVRLSAESVPGLAPPVQEGAPPQASAGGVGRKEWAFVNTDIFARTKIDPSALVQKLDLDTRSVASVRRGWHAALAVGGAYTLKEKPSVLQPVSPSSLEGVEGTKH
ncbi:Hypothetical protein D623_10014968 [Myotis brandtii]|uniref:Uncharacterized protein n=1 Tax=Myotis brandtii TaxID=109478 RepID=S7NGG5_MYOBR|nr:Hypothetical protein D623_10014968 [Myotis brandtii]